MTALLFSILALVVALIGLGMALITRSYDDDATGWWMFAIGVIVAVAIFIAGSVVTVPVGHIAVMSRFGKLTGETHLSGLSFKPIIDTPIILDLRTQKDETTNEAASKDLQDTKTNIATNYRLDPGHAVEVLRTMGPDYWNVFADPAEQEIVKSITATYNAEDMILRREQVKADISSALTKKLAERGIIVEFINITNFEFSPEFTAAIEAKVVAAQNVLQAQNKLEQIKVEAQQAVAKAEGEANAAIARAEGQAKANETISKSLTPEVLQYFFLDKLGTDVKVVVIPSAQGLTLTVPQP